MLMQQKQYDMSQHLVLCSDLLSRENLSSKYMLLRQESTLTLFTQTKQYCNFLKTGLTTLSTLTLFFPATADATSSSEASLER